MSRNIQFRSSSIQKTFIWHLIYARSIIYPLGACYPAREADKCTSYYNTRQTLEMAAKRGLKNEGTVGKRGEARFIVMGEIKKLCQNILTTERERGSRRGHPQ